MYTGMEYRKAIDKSKPNPLQPSVVSSCGLSGGGSIGNSHTADVAGAIFVEMVAARTSHQGEVDCATVSLKVNVTAGTTVATWVAAAAFATVAGATVAAGATVTAGQTLTKGVTETAGVTMMSYGTKAVCVIMVAEGTVAFATVAGATVASNATLDADGLCQQTRP